MRFHQFYLSCLAHASYLIGDGGECAIVDPQRDVDQYVDEAAKMGISIRYVIENAPARRSRWGRSTCRERSRCP